MVYFGARSSKSCISRKMEWHQAVYLSLRHLFQFLIKLGNTLQSYSSTCHSCKRCPIEECHIILDLYKKRPIMGCPPNLNAFPNAKAPNGPPHMLTLVNVYWGLRGPTPRRSWQRLFNKVMHIHIQSSSTRQLMDEVWKKKLHPLVTPNPRTCINSNVHH